MSVNVANGERIKGRNFQRARVVSQVYRKQEHIALNCYHRFDVTYIGNSRLPSGVNNNSKQDELDEIQKSIALFMSQVSAPS